MNKFIALIFISCITLAQARSIEITNGITKKMITYHKFGAHVPKPFTIHANDQLIEPDSSKKITLNNDSVTIKYYFKFGSYREGTDSVTFKVDPKTTKSTLTFAWKTDYRLDLTGAQAIKTTRKI